VTEPPDPRSRPTHQAPAWQDPPPARQGPPPAWQEPPPAWRGQGPQPGWQGPPPPVPGPPQQKRRRRPWVIAAVAVLVVVAVVIGALLALPKPIPPVLQTTGLVAGDRTPQSLQLGWAGPASGPLPDRYEVLRNGHELASVPGTTTDYRVTGLDPATAYRFTVIAIRGAKRATPSSALSITTPTPPLSDAVLTSSGPANVTETAGNFTETYNSKFSKRDVGDTWQEPWSFVPNCTSGPCAVQASGSVVGPQFTTQLTRNGAMYSGSVAIDNWWYCGTNINNRMDTTLNIRVTGVHAKMIAGVWTVTSYTGTLVWNVHYDANGNCPAATYKMKLAGN
jgi:Fibronectin type III domain